MELEQIHNSEWNHWNIGGNSFVKLVIKFNRVYLGFDKNMVPHIFS